MIQKLVRQMLAAQILSAMTVTLCLLVDNIIIGRFLGEGALTAYGLANPVLLCMGAVGNMLCIGAQVSCGRSMGRGDQEETDAGYSATIATGGIFSLLFMVAALLFCVPVARLLGADGPDLIRDTSRYIAGFSIGAPASVASLVLVPFLQMAGQSNLLIIAVLAMTFSDVTFDLMNVFMFHGGIFGMGLASALSYYVAMVIGLTYFLSGKCIYTFTPGLISLRKIRELFLGGLPSLFGMGSMVVMAFALNQILLHIGGEAAVASFSVINTIMNTVNGISTGSGGVALTLSGVLYHKGDRAGLSELLHILTGSSMILGIAGMFLLMVFARPCVELFIPYAGESQRLAIRGLRIYSTGLVFCCLTNVLRNCYQGTGRVGMMVVISVLDNAVFPVLTALLFSFIAGIKGVWFLFLASELTMIFCILVYVWVKKGRITWQAGDLLLLQDK